METLPRLSARRHLALLGLMSLLALPASTASAQGFDPAKVDWAALSKIPMKDGFIKAFNDQCAACHGEDLRGTPLGTPLVGRALTHGDTVEELARSIAAGFPAAGMPAWAETLGEAQIWNLALYVAEQRQGTTILDKRADIPLELPAGTIRSARAAFRVERAASMPCPSPSPRCLTAESWSRSACAACASSGRTAPSRRR